MRYEEAILAPRKMEPLTKLLWVDALRSGDYKQCRFVFQRGEEYCSLGLLSKIAGYRAVMALPDNDAAIIVGMNDNGYTFPQIADYVEETL